MRRLLITDLDNTLYNLIDYFGPSFRAMLHALAKETKIDEEVLKSDFKKVFFERESLEYGFAVQELDISKALPKERVIKLIKLAKGAFKRGRDKYLKPYDTVKDTLEWLNKHGVIIVGMSNAPFFNAQIRLKQLYIDKYFYGLAARENLHIPNDEFTKNVNQRVIEGKYDSSKLKKTWQFKKELLKPNTHSYKKIMDELKINSANTYIIGDSIIKDIQPAIEIGATGIWAKYGEKCSPKNLDTVLSMTNWSQSEIKKVFFDKHIEPKYIVESFGELKNIIEPNQLSLFNE